MNEQSQQPSNSQPDHLRIDKFECHYEDRPIGVVGGTVIRALCVAHEGMIPMHSGYTAEMGEHRPCAFVEAQGVWLFYSDRPYASSPVQRIIVPMQMTFTLDGVDLRDARQDNTRLAWIANGMNVMAAIEEWEAK